MELVQNNADVLNDTGSTVLIVDDNAVHLGLFEDICVNLGYQTITAYNSKDALRIFNNEKIDLVITDILLPDIDGIKLARKIREIDTAVPIMAMTGGNLAPEHEAEINKHPDDGSVITNFFTKGTSLTTIQHTIVAHVENYKLVCSLQEKIKALEHNESEKRGLISTLQGFIDQLAVSEQRYKQLSEQLRVEAEFNNTLVQASPLFIVTISENKVMMMNNAMLEATGYLESDVKGLDYLEVFIPDEERERNAIVFKTLTGNKKAIMVESHLVTREGARLLVEWHGRPILDEDGALSYFFMVGVDITQRRKLQMANLEQQKKLEYLAYHGELGVKNLDFFKLKLRDMRHKSHAILHIKIDGLTNINTHYAEETGNRLILKIAERLTREMENLFQDSEYNGEWVVARVHSVVLLLVPGVQDNIRLHEIALQLSNALDKPFKVKFVEQDIALNISTSIGGSLSSDSNTIEALRHHADVALEAAIEKGPLSSDRISLYDFDLGVQKRLRETREAEIFKSLLNLRENDEFFIKYQPQIEINGTIIGMEALVRMQCRALSDEIISPVEFIPFAEEKGIITNLDLWVLEYACIQTREWIKKGYDLVVSVNFSRKNLKVPGIIKKVDDIIEKTGLNPDFLKLEITEGGLLDTEDREILIQLKKRVRKLAIDDVGTQQAAIGTVTLLKNDQYDILHTIKLDRSLVRGLYDTTASDAVLNKKQAITLSNLIKWFGDLGLKIIVEGVEEQKQIDWLTFQQQETGYKIVLQGFYNDNFPVAAEKFEEKLRENRQEQRILV